MQKHVLISSLPPTKPSPRERALAGVKSSASMRPRLQTLGWAIVCLGCLLASPAARAQGIAWNPPQNITNDSDVVTQGALLYAYDYANSAQTVNGVAFTGANSANAGGNVLTTLNSFNTTAFTSTVAPFTNLSAAYRAMLVGSGYASSAATFTVTVTNLVAGHAYLVQFWVNDPRATINRAETLSSAGGNSDELVYNTVAGTVAGYAGQYAVGYFTNYGTSQTIWLLGVTGSVPQMTALQVRDLGAAPPVNNGTGYWNGLANGTLDNTSLDFCGNSYTAPLSTASLTTIAGLENACVFADSYYNSSTAVGVTVTNITVAAGGVTIGTVNFLNDNLQYTINSSDANGISGGTAVNVLGSGLVTFAGPNTYTGGTTIYGGTVQVGTGGASGSLGNGPVADDAALVYDLSGSPAIAYTISGAGSLTQAGAGTLTLSGDNAYTGATIINAGTLTIGDPGVLNGGAYAGAVTISTNANFDYSSSSAQTISGVISGGGALTQDGPGELTLTAQNTLTGGVTVNGGTLFANGPNSTDGALGNGNVMVNPAGTIVVGGNNSFGVGTTPTNRVVTINAGGEITTSTTSTCHLPLVVINGGTLNANSPNTTYGNWNLDYGVSTPGTGISGAISGGNAALTQTGGVVFNVGSGDTLNVSTALQHLSGSGDNGLIKSGAGLMTLQGANTYTSSTTVSNGTLEVEGSLATGVVTVYAGGTLGGYGTINGPTTIATGGTLELVANSVSVFGIDSSLSLAGNAVLNVSKTGGSLAGDNIYGLTGVTYGGTLTVNNITSDGTHLAAGDTFSLFSLNSGSYGGAFAAFNLPTLTAGLSWNISTLTVNGQISVVTKPATVATPVFTPVAGGYVGTPSVDIISSVGSTIYYTTDGSAPSATSPSGLSPITGIIIPANSNLTINAYATEAGSANSAVASATYTTLNTPVWINHNGGSWAAAANWSNNVIGAGSGVTADFSTLTLPADALVTLDSAYFTIGQLLFGDVGNAHNWEVDPGSGGPLTLAAGTNMPNITVKNTTTTVAAPLAGTSGLSTGGNGALTLSGVNTYSGATIVTAGTLAIGDPGQLGAGAYAGAITISNNANFVYGSSQAQTISGALSGPGTLTTQAGSGTLTFTATGSSTGPVIINGGILRTEGPSANGVFPSAASVTVNNGGTLECGANGFVGYNTHVVPVIINAGGIMTEDGGTGGGPNLYGAITLAGGVIMDGGSLHPTYGSYNFGGLTITANGATTSTISARDFQFRTSTTVEVDSGSILDVTGYFTPIGHAGSFTLTKTGTGTLILAGTNTYGPTVVTNGTLEVDGSLPAAAVTVMTNTTLTGNGTINGPTAIQAGGTVQLATNNIGALGINSTLSLAGNAVFKISKTGGVRAGDNINGLTGVTYGGTLTVTNITSDGTALAAADTFTLFSLSSGSYGGGFAAFNLPTLPGTLNWDVSQLTSSGQIAVVSSTPTPIFSPAAGAYAGAVSVTIFSSPGWTIYYTTDGSTPIASSASGPSPLTGVIVPANTNMTIKAFAGKSGSANSPVASATYATVSTPTWLNTHGGSWAATGNWSNNVIANASGVAADFSALTLPGNALVTLDGAFTVGQMVFGDKGNTYAWEIDAGSGGPLTLAAGTNTPSITVNNTTTTIGAPLAGTVGFVKNGNGILDLTTNEQFVGDTIVNAGALYLDGTNGNTYFNASTLYGMLTVNSGATCVVNQPYALGIGGGLTNIYLNGGTLGGPGYCRVVGLSYLLSGGTINIGESMTMGQTTGAGSLPSSLTTLSNGVTSEVAPVGGLLLEGTFGQTNFVFSVAKGATNGVDLQIDAVISEVTGPCSLTKTGAGTLALDDANTYTGSAVVSNGTLLVNGSIGAGAVIVTAGGTLGGAGTVTGLITNNGTVAPGANAVGALVTSNVTMEAGSTLVFRFSSATNTADQSLLSVDGTLDFEGLSGGHFTIKLVSMTNNATAGLLPDFNPASNYTWTVAAAAGIIANVTNVNQLVIDATAFANAHPGTFSVSNAGNNVVVSYAPAVALVAPTISAVRVSNGSFEMTFDGPAGQMFKVVSTNVLGAPLGTWPALTNGTFGAVPVNFIDPSGTTNKARFYGIVSP